MRFARPLVTATTMLAVAAMAVVTSVPANALLSSDDLAATRAAAGGSAPVQQLAAFEAEAAAIARDGYTVHVAPKLTPAAAGSPAASVLTPRPAGSAAVRWPVDSLRISDDFGPRVSPCSGCSSMHMGTDFLPGEGSPVYAIADGVVTQVVQSDVGLGVHVVIDHIVDGELIRTTSAHMQFGSVRVGVGETVSTGDVIGQVGNTGASTGAHLHFELRVGGTEPVDPYAWLAARAS